MEEAASDTRQKLEHMTGGATTSLVFEVKFSTRQEWVNYLRDFKRNGGQRALLERLPAYIADEHGIMATATDAVGMYRINKEYDGVHLRSSYYYWIKLTLVGVPIMSMLSRQRIADSLLCALNDILEGRPVKSATLVIY